MSYILKTHLADSSNYTKTQYQKKYIVIHYTANDGDSDEANANYFAQPNRNASAHYFVDDDSVTISVPGKYTAWSVGGKKYSDCNVTGGGKYYGICTNNNSISIELCDTKRDGTVKATQSTIDNAIELTKKLMKEYNIPQANVIRHFDVTGKRCPEYWIDENVWKTEFWNKLSTPTSQPIAWKSSLHYRVHQQSIGWEEVHQSGEVAGQVGKSLRVEAIKIDYPKHDVYAKAHIQSKGWVDYGKITSDTIIGSVGQSKRIECICLKGNFRYRVYLQKTGWTAWTKADGISTLGTVGQELRIEAIQLEELK